MHLGIVGGNDEGEEDGDEPDAEQDGAEPPPGILCSYYYNALFIFAYHPLLCCGTNLIQIKIEK